MSSFFRSLARIALPVLGTMIPGVGPVIGGALGGAAGGALGGGGLRGALMGAATGGLGGALGGATSALGTAPSTINWTAAAPGYSLGTTQLAGTGLRGVLGGGGMGALSGSGGLNSLVRTGASLYSAAQEDDALREAQRAQLAALRPYEQMSRQAQGQLSKNLAEGFNPGDLRNDPGYQFRLKQGMDALNASLAAQGLGQSGQALRAAQEYGQNFAQNEYGNAYDRWLQQNQQLGNLGGQGMQAATGIGNVNSAASLAQAEARNRRIAEILQGLGIQ